jgi:hypothetical protein
MAFFAIGFVRQIFPYKANPSHLAVAGKIGKRFAPALQISAKLEY